MAETTLLFPVGRLVGGSLYKSRPTLDNAGKPKLNAAGQPAHQFSFGVAYAKNGQPWQATPWGQVVHAAGVAGFPNGEYNAPTFAWKITDGDSVIPNKRGNKPCDNEGFPGHWVVWFSGSFAPNLTDKHGTREGTMLYSDGTERIKPGHMIEVYASVKDNKPSQSPGVYMNYKMVAHNDASTPEIALSEQVDSTAVGFGGARPAQAAAPAQQYAAPPPAQVAVAPAPAYMAPPPPAAVAPPPAPVRQMTAKANGATYEQFIAQGWTEALLREHGMMV